MVAVLRPCRWGRLFLGGGPGCLLGLAAWCARGRRPTREPSAPRASLGASTRCPARPRHRPRAPQPGPPAPSGALHTSGACVAGVCRPGSAAHGHSGLLPDPPAPFTPVGPGVLSFWMLWCVLLQTSSIGGVFRVDFCLVVTNVVIPTAFWLKMVVFWLRLTTYVTEAVAGRFKSRWFDDVCNVGRPPVARPGPAGAHAHRSLAPAPTMGVVSGSRSLA